MIAQDERQAPGAPIRSFGRRKGRRLRPGRRGLLDRLLPEIAVPLTPPGSTLDPAALFPPGKTAFWLEVGFGAGEHLAWQAAHHPDIGLIGCEPFVNGVSSLLHRIEEGGLDNIRIHPDDARPLIDALPDASIDRVLATRFGSAAVRAIHEDHFGCMVALRGSEPRFVPLSEVVGSRRAIDPEGERVWTAESMGISFGRG